MQNWIKAAWLWLATPASPRPLGPVGWFLAAAVVVAFFAVVLGLAPWKIATESFALGAASRGQAWLWG